MNSLSRRRSGARNGARLAELAIAEEKRRQAEVETERAAAVRERRRAARAAEAARPKFTGADLAGASHVRDDAGWHRVVRVSEKSVTVETAYSWTERIPVTRVLQFARDGRALPAP